MIDRDNNRVSVLEGRENACQIANGQLPSPVVIVEKFVVAYLTSSQS